ERPLASLCTLSLHDALPIFGYTALFVTVSEAIRAVRRTWRREAQQSEDEVLRCFTQSDLLILDEVGVQYGTEAEQVTLFEIINRDRKSTRLNSSHLVISYAV